MFTHRPRSKAAARLFSPYPSLVVPSRWVGKWLYWQGWMSDPYASFDTAVDLALSVDSVAWLAKSDIKSAFRLLPVSPDDYELLGFTFQDQFYYDRCLPMGCSVSCRLFETFSTFLEFCVKQVSRPHTVTHYSDDFLLIGRSMKQCKVLLNTFQGICAWKGLDK